MMSLIRAQKSHCPAIAVLISKEACIALSTKRSFQSKAIILNSKSLKKMVQEVIEWHNFPHYLNYDLTILLKRRQV